MPFQADEPLDFGPAGVSNVDQIKVARRKKSLRGHRTLKGERYKRPPDVIRTSPFLKRLGEEAAFIVAGRNEERTIECPKIRDTFEIRGVGIVYEAQYLDRFF